MGVRVRQNKMELVSIGSEQGQTRDTFAIAFLLHIVTETSFYPIVRLLDRQMIKYWLSKYGTLFDYIPN